MLFQFLTLFFSENKTWQVSAKQTLKNKVNSYANKPTRNCVSVDFQRKASGIIFCANVPQNRLHNQLKNMISFIFIHLFPYKKKDAARTPRQDFRETRDHARKTNLAYIGLATGKKRNILDACFHFIR